jgi:hypothetical protein
MNLEKINDYLMTFNGTELNPDIPDFLAILKKIAVKEESQEKAKYIWCLEQVYIVINHYLNAFSKLKRKEYYEAWCLLERADIEHYFLRKHLDYNGNKYNLEFIEKNINQLQKLFPYQFFMSRESVVKKWYCSICNEEITLRKSCGHKIGEIYNGEQCCRVAGDIQFLAIAIVTDPFDKYSVIFPEGMEYNYQLLDNLMNYFKHPYEKWNLLINKKLKPEYEELGKNRKCICNSGKKYKMCCLKTGDNQYDHYHIDFYVKEPESFTPLPDQVIHTWKS